MIVWPGNVHLLIEHQRHRLPLAADTRLEYPFRGQPSDVGGINLLQITESPTLRIAAIGGPIGLGKEGGYKRHQ